MYLLAPIFWLLAFKKSFFGLAKFGLAFCLEFAVPLQASLPPPCLTLLDPAPPPHTKGVKFSLAFFVKLFCLAHA
ncbi:hypothetical protein MG150_000038 [Campylobacter upsaliensis]|nr:hypothetical protein [Campylobacter upsaliensis]